MSERLVLSKEEKLVLEMLNSACALAARQYESAVLATLMDVLSDLRSGRIEAAVERLARLKE